MNLIPETVTSFEAATHTSDETEALGEALGRSLRAGDLVLLYGDLGAGKTCFTRGVARGLGIDSSENVSSPTFTLVHSYRGTTPVFHCDFYRLAESAVTGGAVDPLGEGIDLDDALSRGVVIVEWPEPAQVKLDATRARRRFDVRLEWLREDARRIRWVLRDANNRFAC